MRHIQSSLVRMACEFRQEIPLCRGFHSHGLQVLLLEFDGISCIPTTISPTGAQITIWRIMYDSEKERL